MANKVDEHEYRIRQLERKTTGVQRRMEVMNALHEKTISKHERRIRDLEIKTAVQAGVPNNRVAKIYELSPGRITQIVKKVG